MNPSPFAAAPCFEKRVAHCASVQAVPTFMPPVFPLCPLAFLAQESVLNCINTSAATRTLMEATVADPRVEFEATELWRLLSNAFSRRAWSTLTDVGATLVTSALVIPYAMCCMLQGAALLLPPWIPFRAHFGPSNAESAILRRCEAFFEWPSAYTQGSRYRVAASLARFRFFFLFSTD